MDSASAAGFSSVDDVSTGSPADFCRSDSHHASRFAVASGLSAQSNGFITYDNLFWPGGSVPVCNGYPFSGGFLDVYGLAFNIGNGQVVNFWSNGAMGPGAADYGAAVVTAATAQDYVGGGITTTTTPEPSSVAMLGSGLLGLVGFVKRRVTA